MWKGELLLPGEQQDGFCCFKSLAHFSQCSSRAGMHPPWLSGISLAAPVYRARQCAEEVGNETVSLWAQGKWIFKWARRNEPEDALERSWDSDSLRGYIKAKTGDWRMQMLRNCIPQGDLWVTESELLLLLKTSIPLNCLAGWDQALCTFSHTPTSPSVAQMANKFLYKVTKLLQLSLKWEDKFEINFQKSLIYQQCHHDYLT